MKHIAKLMEKRSMSRRLLAFLLECSISKVDKLVSDIPGAMPNKKTREALEEIFEMPIYKILPEVFKK